MVYAVGEAVVGFGVLVTTYRYVLTLVGIEGYTNTGIGLYLATSLLTPTLRGRSF